MIIRLKVFEQTLSIVDTKSVPRKGSKDYLALQFLFSSDWKDLDKICYLQKGDVSQPIDVVDGLVEVPEWFTEQDSFDVTLFGKGGSQEVPTNVVSLRLEKSNTLWEQDAPEPQPSWLAKIIDLNNHPPIPGSKGYWLLWDTDSGAYVESELPLPDISVGPQGPKGDTGATGPQGPKGADGSDGGYYTPSVTQPDANTMRLSFSPSKEGMPAVAETDITLPSGGSGSVAVDSTLTVSGQAADAKAVGDALAKKQDKPDIRTSLDDVAVAGAQYYLGEQTEVSIVLPDDADVGQMVLLSWYNGETAATLSITGTMLDFDYTPGNNSRSEINALWDGVNWAVLGNEMAVVADA